MSVITHIYVCDFIYIHIHIYSHSLCIICLLKLACLSVAFARKITAKFNQIKAVLRRKVSLLFPASDLCLHVLLYTKLYIHFPLLYL